MQANIHLGNLVEQQGAVVRFLELAEAARDGAREGAFFRGQTVPDSIRFAGIAAQLTAMNGLVARVGFSCGCSGR